MDGNEKEIGLGEAIGGILNGLFNSPTGVALAQGVTGGRGVESGGEAQQQTPSATNGGFSTANTLITAVGVAGAIASIIALVYVFKG